jgi:hypothetical protein
LPLGAVAHSLTHVIYVVERYLPGLAPSELARSLERLEHETVAIRGEGIFVRYLGSTIIPSDEFCLCQFEGPSEAAVAEVNRRADITFDRVLAAVAVPPAAAPPPIQKQQGDHRC